MIRMSGKVMKRELDCHQNETLEFETISKRIKNEPIEQQEQPKGDELTTEALKIKLEASEARCISLEEENQSLKARLNNFNDVNNQLNLEVNDLKFLVKNKNQQLITIKDKHYTEMDKIVANYEERIAKYESKDEVVRIQSEKSLLEVQFSILKQEYETECNELKNKIKIIQDELNAKVTAFDTLNKAFKDTRDKMLEESQRLKDELKKYKNQSTHSKLQKNDHRRSKSERGTHIKENFGHTKEASKSINNSRRHVHIINDNNSVKKPLNIQVTTN